jgi:hypothetical protein
MAFNPFNAFRKHQKVIYAALTIICMFTFVASAGISGRGDFFGEIAAMVGMRSRAPIMATLDGKELDEDEFKILRYQRRLANTFMGTAVRDAKQLVTNDVFGPRSPLDENTKKELERILSSWQSGGMFAPQFVFGELSRLYEQLSKANPGQAAAIERFSRVLQQQSQEFQRMIRPDELYSDSSGSLYFGGSLSPQGILDFLVWRREADRLGIQLSHADVMAQVQKETFNAMSPRDFDLLERQLARSGPAINILTALADELRVRLAQIATLGYDPAHVTEAGAPISPYEFWEYYRRNRTEASVRLLDVPVEHFLTEVKEKPSEKELRDLFTKYQDEEYDPAKIVPGFKLPRRAKVEWIAASTNSEYYKKEAETRNLALVAGIVSNPPVSALMPLALIAAPVHQAYNFESTSGKLRLGDWTEKDFSAPLYAYAYLLTPQAAASIVGQIAGAVSTSSAPMLSVDAAAFSVLVGQQGCATVTQSRKLAGAVEQVAKNRVPFACAFLAANPLGSAISNALALGGIWNAGRSSQQDMPMEAVQDRLVRKVEQDLAGELVRSGLAKFKQELESKRGRPSEAAKFIAEEVKKHGWKHGITKEARTRFDIQSDPDLVPLKEAFNNNRFSSAEDVNSKEFARKIFFDKSADPQRNYTLFDEVEDGHNQTTYSFWRTEDLAPSTLTFEKARPKVEAAWRFEKARQLARAQAESIRKQAQETKGDAVRTLTEASGKVAAKIMPLDGITRLKRTPSSTSGVDASYEEYKVPEKDMEYPPGDFLDKIMNLKEKGEVAFFSDRPEAHFYVAALVERFEPSIKDFYSDSSTFSFQGNTLLKRFEDEKRKQYRREIMAALREQARARLTDNSDVLKSFEERGEPTD